MRFVALLTAIAVAVVFSSGAPPQPGRPRDDAVGLYPTIKADARGHYIVDARIGARSIEMLVDTGATVVALTYEDARRLGVLPARDAFTVPIRTANGVTHAAPLLLEEISVRMAVVENVEALVLPRGASDQSLLGMTYLSRLSAFEIRRGALYIRQ